MLKWGFDLQGGNKNKTGQNAFGTLLDNTARKVGGLLSLFVREVLSNSADQRLLNSTHPVRIYIDIISISSDTKKNFKKALDWDSLKKHISASASTKDKTVTSSQLGEGLKNIDDDDEITQLVRISDYNSYGLCGPEDDVDDDGNSTVIEGVRRNFELFAKSTFITSQDAGRQGAFGLGKGVLYHLSSLKTVLMSSTILNEEGVGTIRTFGRTELPFHRCDRESFDGPGFFGSIVKDSKGRNSTLSSYDDNQVSLESLFLDRDSTLGTGTSAISLAFQSAEIGNGDSEGLIMAFEKAVKKWFWPALSSEKPPIEVYIRNFDNKNLISEKRIKPGKEYEAFISSFTEPSNALKLKEVGDIVAKDLEWEIPKKRPAYGGDASFRGKGIVQIQASNVLNSELSNKIALVRDNLCVVQYEDIRLHSDESSYFYGTFKAGKARGIESDDLKFYEFLRAAEPPLHDSWRYARNIEIAYVHDKVPSLLRSIYDDIVGAAEDIVDVANESTNVDYSHLEDLFDLGKEGQGEVERGLSFKQFGEEMNGSKVSTKALIKNLEDNSNWEAKVIFSIDEAKKKEHDLHLQSISIIDCAGSVDVTLEGGSGFISVTGSKEITIEVTSEIKSNITLQKAKELTYSLTIFSQRA